MSFISKSDYMDLFLRYAAPLTKHIRDGGLYIGEQAAVYKESTARTEGFLRVLWGGLCRLLQAAVNVISF